MWVRRGPPTPPPPHFSSNIYYSSHLQELCKLKESINKNYTVKDTLNFSDSDTTPHSSLQGKRRIKKNIQKQTSTTIQLESTNKTHRKLQIDSHKAQK